MRIPNNFNMVYFREGNMMLFLDLGECLDEFLGEILGECLCGWAVVVDVALFDRVD